MRMHVVYMSIHTPIHMSIHVRICMHVQLSIQVSVSMPDHICMRMSQANQTSHTSAHASIAHQNWSLIVRILLWPIWWWVYMIVAYIVVACACCGPETDPWLCVVVCATVCTGMCAWMSDYVCGTTSIHCVHLPRTNHYSLHSYGLYSYGLYSYGLYSHCLYNSGLFTCGVCLLRVELIFDCTCMAVCALLWLRACVRACMCPSDRACVCACVDVSICVCMRVCVCIHMRACSRHQLLTLHALPSVQHCSYADPCLYTYRYGRGCIFLRTCLRACVWTCLCTCQLKIWSMILSLTAAL